MVEEQNDQLIKNKDKLHLTVVKHFISLYLTMT